MKKITVVLIGAGSRGMYAYAPYALDHPDEIQFVAVAEPNIERREMFRKTYSISMDMCFDSWSQLFEKPKLADAALICTQDNLHFEPTAKLLEKGYSILLEKPMSNNVSECIALEEYAKKYQQVFFICHVLRYTSFFSTIKKLVSEGRIGKLVSIQHNENVAYWHYSHSYVRGNWRSSKDSSPMILAKCCHDMDMLLWLADSECKRISSFGSLSYFKDINAPEGAPARCLDGCPAEKTCPYHVAKLYLTDNTDWPTSVICNDMSMESRIGALKDGPYGRCVFRCDNNVVDHQVVNMEFDNGVTAAFTMCAFTNDCNRSIKLMGTKGEIRASDKNNEIEIHEFGKGSVEIIKLDISKYGHGGGDYGIMYDFIRSVAKGNASTGLTNATASVQSHLMAFASEKSRLEGHVVDLKEYEGSLRKTI